MATRRSRSSSGLWIILALIALIAVGALIFSCLLYTSPSPRDS